MYYEYKPENEGVYELLSKLCEKAAEKYSVQSRISQKLLAAKLRSQSYEIILKKSASIISPLGSDPLIDLLSYYFVSQKSAKNVAEYKKSVQLKTTINKIRSTNFGEQTELVNNVLKLLNALQNSVKPDLSAEMFQNPFSFGLLDEMLPKPKRQTFGSPQPYSYFPSYVFDLPYSLKRPGKMLNKQSSQSYSEYTVESFDSRLFISENSQPERVELKTFLSPMSLASMTSTALSPYSETTMLNYPRLTAPRDLLIPTQESRETNFKISFASSNMKSDAKVIYGAEHDDSLNIWEIASQIDKDVPDNIWEIVSKLPPITERHIIAASAREVALWKQMYSGDLRALNVVSEKQFIRHIMYLIMGVETNSFPFSQESNCFYMKDKLIIEGVSEEHLVGFVSTLLGVGTYYRRLYNFAFSLSVEDNFHSKGLVYEAAREVIRRYLLDFRLKATNIYEDSIKKSNQELNCMPTLLEILHHMEPLKYEIETIATIYRLVDADSLSLPHGAELMSYLFSEISLVTHKRTALVLYNCLLSICKVYFKFIERFIFEGELNDVYNEFFIRKDNEFVNSRSKRYWDKGFRITLSVAIPDFLRPLASFILLCGKSLRLLKLCNPSDPLVQVMVGHPVVPCCSSFRSLVLQQQVAVVYRTRCLFVSPPVTFTQLLLKREAERKAFTEMASSKRAETVEKIVAERKRLAQLIIAEKQHSLRVLEAAMAEARENKNRKKRRERRLCEMESEADRVGDVVDTRLRDDEKNKIMEYYSKLNIEVEKSKIHTEWKIKRLQLDQSRIQLLSTEERNLKREKLELEHQKNESIMAMSIQSDFKSDDEVDINNEDSKTPDAVPGDVIDIDTEINKNKNKAQSSSDVFSAICNVAKSIFGVSKTKEEIVCDNEVKVDVQGNIVNVDEENNQLKVHQTSSTVIGADLNEASDNLRFLENRQNAMKNKLKVMTQEFGTTDTENNRLKDLSPPVKSSVDQENNIEWNPYTEAKRNKLKVLTAEFDLDSMKQESKGICEPITEALKAAVINKQKVLGVEYNAPIERIDKKDPINIAQKEALRNKNKVMSSDYEDSLKVPKFDSAKKSGLRLNLKPYSEVSGEKVVTPTTTGAVTPGELFPRLDLETPTTAEIPTDGAMTSDVFTPRSEGKDLDSNDKPDKEFLTSDGFNFSMIDDEETATADDLHDGRTHTSAETTHTHTHHYEASTVHAIHGSYSLDSFDPFGVKGLRGFTRDYFNNKINDTQSFYTHPAIIMEEVKKKPYNNIFASQCNPENEEMISCDSIATLTACLQRSVMVPLTYQLEIVNNSILTHFLVNLDMYEHMRSLKDYFFLMDGEFSRSICNNLFSKLTKTLNPQELLNFSTLHNILDKALGSSISHIHKFSENLSFSMSECPLSLQHSSPDVLSCVSLSYSVSWPLNIILSHEALLRYAKVFQFLIKMRRIFWVLSEDFEALKLTVKLSPQHSRKLLKSPQYISVQIYRHIMASLIRALDNYIVTTCILTSWTEFEEDLKKARTLDDLYECHVAYIKKVLFRCLLNNRSTPVMKLLNDIFTVILKFSRVLKAGEWQQKEVNGNFMHTSYIQLQELFHLFEKLAKYLHKVITKLMECGYQRHLVELLTMINLNGYYDPDRSKEDTNTSMQSN